jgi:hypothetical protein
MTFRRIKVTHEKDFNPQVGDIVIFSNNVGYLRKDGQIQKRYRYLVLSGGRMFPFDSFGQQIRNNFMVQRNYDKITRNGCWSCEILRLET